MSFNPLEHAGIPLDEQLRDWRELDVEPIDPDHADPYTRYGRQGRARITATPVTGSKPAESRP
jgi:hypothetical protein